MPSANISCSKERLKVYLYLLREISNGTKMFEIEINGMTCGGCVKSITNSLQKIDTNAKIDISLEKQLARIETTLTQDKIIAAIEGSGFDVISCKLI